MFFVQGLYCGCCETNVCFLYKVDIVGGVRVMYVFCTRFILWVV